MSSSVAHFLVACIVAFVAYTAVVALEPEHTPPPEVVQVQP